ncbi:nuclear transport factor 2-like protein [Algoriphagus machipongonensis]|uniref:SnoaL-like domain-containing protein n=1 Tax=Algoriphagus machipongonensis TaxID=388413 RepID=A3HV35_9BACT|nr:hypothetical protein [Algoriphagus machipongonensis]EAZ82007.1 hypothetical protein ALPR1_02160 [Algoriphagus machipongonensis]
MKYLFMLGSILMIVSCSQNQRYTQQSPEIEIFESVVANYVNGEWSEYESKYAEGAEIFFNATEENPSSIQEAIAGQRLNLEPLSSYTIETDDDELEMVVTDDGETWVNYWGLWKGTIAATGETIETPIHITSQFVDGKIVKTFGYWNNAPMQLAMMKIQEEAEEMASNETEEEDN